MVAIAFLELDQRLPAHLLYLVQYARQVNVVTREQTAMLVAQGLAAVDDNGRVSPTDALLELDKSLDRTEVERLFEYIVPTPVDFAEELAQREREAKELLLKRRLAKLNKRDSRTSLSAAHPLTTHPDEPSHRIDIDVDSIDYDSPPPQPPQPAQPPIPAASTLSFAPSHRRPTALDLDAEPISVAAPDRPISIFQPLQPQSLVLEFSDDEDEGEAETEAAASRSPAPIDAERVKLLSEKESEIEKMMARIKAIEDAKKRRLAVKSAPFEGNATPISASVSPAPPVEEELADAKAELGQLEEERQEIIADVEAAREETSSSDDDSDSDSDDEADKMEVDAIRPAVRLE